MNKSENGYGHILGKRPAAGTVANYAFRTSSSGTGWEAYFANGGWKGAWNQHQVKKDTWLYMTAVYDAKDKITIYENAEEIGGASGMGKPAPRNDTDVNIGGWTNNTSETLDGMLYEVAIFASVPGSGGYRSTDGGRVSNPTARRTRSQTCHNHGQVSNLDNRLSKTSAAGALAKWLVALISRMLAVRQTTRRYLWQNHQTCFSFSPMTTAMAIFQHTMDPQFKHQTSTGLPQVAPGLRNSTQIPLSVLRVEPLS